MLTKVRKCGKQEPVHKSTARYQAHVKLELKCSV